jgi:putative transposase
MSPLRFSMSDYLRPHITGATIFFTVTLARRGGDLLWREIGHLRAAVKETRADLPFDIVAWVVLPDHLHAIWRLPTGDSDYSTRWKAIKTRFTKSVSRSGGFAAPRSASKVAKGERGIWQRRFWDHHIRDQADLDAHIRYCWINPVKHGLVERAADWPYSSIHRDIARGMVEPEWSGVVPEGQFGE